MEWNKRWLAVLVIAAVLPAGCTSEHSFPSGTGSNDKTGSGNPTFNQDIGPLLQSKCMQCHAAGRVEAAVQFGTYAQVKRMAMAISAEINQGTMPPWPMAHGAAQFAPGHDLPELLDNRTLTANEINLINTWIINRTPEGTGGTMKFEPLPTDLLSGPSVQRLTLPQPFTPKPSPGSLDQYRCFILNPLSTQSDQWITAYQMQPDQTQELHHVVLMMPLTEADMTKAKQLETTPGQGYDCWTGPGPNVNAMIVGLWAPGTNINRFPKQTAERVPKGMGFIVQVHYNTRSGATPDQSSILIESQPQQGLFKPAFFMPQGCCVGNTATSFIPLNNPDAQYSQTDTFAKMLGAKSVTVYGVYPHAHRLGTRLHSEYRAAASDQILPIYDNVPWEFNWQTGYNLAKPLELSGNDKITTTCHYDTTLDSLGNDITGVHRTGPIPMGDFTTDEMCFTFFFVSVHR